MRKKCKHCEEGYVKKHGVYTPCKHCITPERFEKTLEKAIAGCGSDFLKKKVLLCIKDNLPSYPIMALMEAENYGQFSKDFITMLAQAYDVRQFKDVEYKPI
tara:strand:- start:1209 stop:1514 length:306 start_codon:yes stop_codon:yes gene_type:complete